MRRISKKTLLTIAMVLVFIIYIFAGIGANRILTVIAGNKTVFASKTVVVDAGHGGEDGGAVSCTGIMESKINLEISERLRDLLNLFGITTIMVRSGDYSVYTHGQSLSQKKVSDLKKRVQIVEDAVDPLLVSIHQNYYSDSRYSGAQVFYGKSANSKLLAERMQSAFVSTLNPGSNRREKAAQNIYLLESVHCDAILVECGFLSNPQEEKCLNDGSYQKKICCVIAGVVSNFIDSYPALA